MGSKAPTHLKALMNRNAAFGWLVLLLTASGLSAQTTSFTYQGRLHSPDGPVNGSYDFTFNLHGMRLGVLP